MHGEVGTDGAYKIEGDMRYDYSTFMDLLCKLIDIAEEGGGAVFDDTDQEEEVIRKLKEIECLM